jgi:hypothetical protein
MKPRLIASVALAAGVLAACGGSSSGGGGTHARVAADCAAPTLAVSPTAAAAGDTVQASGEWFASDCYDMGEPGTPPALTSLTVQVAQGEQTWTVASDVDATGDHYAFEVPIVLPDDLQPGAAQVAVKGYATPVEIDIKG